MNKPKTISAKGWYDNWVELTALFVIITISTTYLMQVHWVVATLMAPFVMAILLLSVVTVVQMFWLLVVGLDRVGTICGMRKTPLS